MEVRKKRTEEELKQISEHLLYELRMFLTLSKSLSIGIFGKGLLKNAVLEAYTIHARVILDFLFNPNPKPDDVLAIDFLDDSQEWIKMQNEMYQQIKTIRNRVAKEVAHLTYKRIYVTADEKSWKFEEITDEIMRMFNLFIARVPKNYLCEEWFDYISSNGNDGN